MSNTFVALLFSVASTQLEQLRTGVRDGRKDGSIAYRHSRRHFRGHQDTSAHVINKDPSERRHDKSHRGLQPPHIGAAAPSGQRQALAHI